jgi:triacylglycerol lipase
MSSLPMYFPSDFDLETAQLCADLTAHAYRMYAQWVKQDKPRKEERFRWRRPRNTGLRFSSPIWSTIRTLFITNDSEPFGFVASDGAGKGYMVFRGTASVNNWFLDLDSDQDPYDLASNYGEVHDGFLKLYRSLRDDALRALDEVDRIESLWVTGHSLGGALSTLATTDVIAHRAFQSVEHYNFASPRVGNRVFADAYNRNGARTFRVVNTSDLVPQTPSANFASWNYKHVGAPVNFTAHYGTIGSNHSLTQAYRYALAHPQEPEKSDTLVAQPVGV